MAPANNNNASNKQSREQHSRKISDVQPPASFTMFFFSSRSLRSFVYTRLHIQTHTFTLSGALFLLFRSIQKVVAFLKTEKYKNYKLKILCKIALSFACFVFVCSPQTRCDAMEGKTAECVIPPVCACLWVWVRGNRQGNPLYTVGDLITQPKQLFATFFRTARRDSTKVSWNLFLSFIRVRFSRLDLVSLTNEHTESQACVLSRALGDTR